MVMNCIFYPLRIFRVYPAEQKCQSFVAHKKIQVVFCVWNTQEQKKQIHAGMLT